MTSGPPELDLLLKEAVMLAGAPRQALELTEVKALELEAKAFPGTIPHPPEASFSTQETSLHHFFVEAQLRRAAALLDHLGRIIEAGYQELTPSVVVRAAVEHLATAHWVLAASEDLGRGKRVEVFEVFALDEVRNVSHRAERPGQARKACDLRSSRANRISGLFGDEVTLPDVGYAATATRIQTSRYKIDGEDLPGVGKRVGLLLDALESQGPGPISKWFYSAISIDAHPTGVWTLNQMPGSASPENLMARGICDVAVGVDLSRLAFESAWRFFGLDNELLAPLRRAASRAVELVLEVRDA